METQKFRFH